MPPVRTCCVWCPGWAIATARRAVPGLVGVPVAVVEPGAHGLVVRAASAEARADGVVAGLRRREAEARCPGLRIVEADLAAEARAFEIVARATEPITPAVVLERPGTLMFPTHGPSRYFGGDDSLAGRALAAVTAAGARDARAGIADGGFAARLAARSAAPGQACVIAPGGSPAFLAPWPVGVLPDGDDDDLPALLVRLGLSTLGAFAGLPPGAVLGRFGTGGAHAHRLACGLDELATPPVPSPPDLTEACELDPPARRVDEVAFAAKGLADRLLARLEARGLACTQVIVEAETEHGERLTRRWRHEGALTAAALVARVRWQLDGWLTAPFDADVEEVTGGLTLVRLAPDQLIPAVGRQLGFWGGDAAATDRADRCFARLQGMLGHDAVVTARRAGGRAPSERVRWVPWGQPRDDPLAPVGATLAWPGTVPGPAPARVYAPPRPAQLLDVDGRPLMVSGRGEASAAPAWLGCEVLPAGGGEVATWAGPWAHDVRWWDRLARRRRVLWQLVVASPDGEQLACLVTVENGRAGIEAVYD